MGGALDLDPEKIQFFYRIRFFNRIFKIIVLWFLHDPYRVSTDLRFR